MLSSTRRGQLEISAAREHCRCAFNQAAQMGISFRRLGPMHSSYSDHLPLTRLKVTAHNLNSAKRIHLVV
jgi:hypothetical protein